MISLIAIFLVLANIILITFLNKTVIGRLERFASRIRMIASTIIEPQVLGEKQSLDRIAESVPCRVLVADDAPTSRLIIRELLEEAGYEVETVENSQQLVEWLRDDIKKHSDSSPAFHRLRSLLIFQSGHQVSGSPPSRCRKGSPRRR